MDIPLLPFTSQISLVPVPRPPTELDLAVPGTSWYGTIPASYPAMVWEVP
jgi:hypothetical protein